MPVIEYKTIILISLITLKAYHQGQSQAASMLSRKRHRKSHVHCRIASLTITLNVDPKISWTSGRAILVRELVFLCHKSEQLKQSHACTFICCIQYFSAASSYNACRTLSVCNVVCKALDLSYERQDVQDSIDIVPSNVDTRDKSSGGTDRW